MENCPNLSDSINNAIVKQRGYGGVNVWKLEPGVKVFAHTRNSIYEIEATGNENYVIIKGGKYFTKPIKARFHGSTFGGSMIKVGYIGHMMHMEISYPHPTKPGKYKGLLTTGVRSATIIGPDWEYQMEWSNDL